MKKNYTHYEKIVIIIYIMFLRIIIYFVILVGKFGINKWSKNKYEYYKLIQINNLSKIKKIEYYFYIIQFFYHYYFNSY